MSISLTQLQGFNVAYKLLDYYWEQTNSDEIGGLAGDMLFFSDGGTADPAIWGDWLKAIYEKTLLTKQESFDGLIHFLDSYRKLGEVGDVSVLINQLNLAKNCDDITVHLVEKWNHFLMEVLSEPEGTREYLFFGDPLENINRKQTFNAVYKLLNIYGKEVQSKELVALAEGMLFLSDGSTTLDADVRSYWKKILADTLTLKKEQAFEITKLFLEEYGNGVSSSEALSIVTTLRSAKNSDDFSVYLVDLWDYCLRESLSEPAGMTYYLKNYKK